MKTKKNKIHTTVKKKKHSKTKKNSFSILMTQKIFRCLYR
jgi:hypothetical protein